MEKAQQNDLDRTQKTKRLFSMLEAQQANANIVDKEKGQKKRKLSGF